MKLSPRDERLQEVMDIKPIGEDQLVNDESSLPIMTTNLTDLDIKDLEGEVDTLYKLASSAIDIKDIAIREVDDCMTQVDKASLISSATTALSASINAIDKATRIKMSLLKLKGLKKPETESKVFDRNQLLEALQDLVDDPSKKT